MKRLLLIPILMLLPSITMAGDYALSFTRGGANDSDHVKVPYDVSLILGYGTTLETWAEFDDLSNGQVIMSKAYFTSHISPYFDWLIYLAADGSIDLRIKSSTWSPTHDALSLTDTTHLVFTADGTTWTLYINGVEVDDTGIATLPTNDYSQPVLFGMNVEYGEQFDGMLDEVRVYNMALDSATVVAHYNAGSGTCSYETDSLKGYWPFAEGSGTTAGDSSGVGNDGDLLPSGKEPSWVTGIGLDCGAAAAGYGAQVIIIGGQ